MIEFFKSIGTWIVENKDSIVAVLMSSQFIAFVTMLFNLIKSKKGTTQNTEVSKKLIVKLDELNEKLEEFNEIKSTVSELIKVTNNIEIELSKSNSNTELVISKLNAQLDAQCTVWSTIKDDKLRELVTNIVTNAKYLETSDVSNLRKQLIELEQKLSEQADNIKKDVADTVKQVNKTVKSNDTVMRV